MKSCMYMHTLYGRPASYCDIHGWQNIFEAGYGHASRAAVLVPSLDQIHSEQQAAIASAERDKVQHPFLGDPHPDSAYGYVLVRIPEVGI